jgi:hypothetical protein
VPTGEPGFCRGSGSSRSALEGFSLHADTAVHGHDRQGLERLCRYGARGPVAESRLRRLDDGRYEYSPKKGTAFTLTAAALVRRLVALLPPARLHLTLRPPVDALVEPRIFRSQQVVHFWRAATGHFWRAPKARSHWQTLPGPQVPVWPHAMLMEKGKMR